jgi:hypothetical protein
MLNGKQLAAELGVSPPMVVKYKAAGRIRPLANGLFDLDECRASLSHSLGAKQGGVPRRGDRVAAKPVAPVAVAPVVEPKPRKLAAVAKPKRAAIAKQVEPSREQSKADLEREALLERIRRDRLRNDKEERRLVDRAEVESATEARFRADAEALLNWPLLVHREVAAELGSEERTTRLVLEKYVRQFMTERSMAKSK